MVLHWDFVTFLEMIMLTRRGFLNTMAWAGVAGLGGFGMRKVAAAGAPPNILLILTDDQGWSQLSEALDPAVPEARSRYLETPRMDRLGREGIRFTSGYSPAPLCTPTRRSILCGTTTARSGTEFKSSWVPAEHLTMPKALKMANPDYRCAHFGKWGSSMISTPEECGYDASDGMTGNITGGMPRSLNPDNPKASHTNTPPHYIDNDDPKRSRSVTSNAIEFMRTQVEAARPFYVQASYYAVHLSVVTEEETLEEYRQKGAPDRGYTQAWAAMLDDLDTQVGRLLDSLEEAGVSSNTYVVFTTDNGGRGTVPGGDTSRLAPNFPLTGAKHSLYEGGIRVPFLVRGPGIPPGAHCDTPVAGYDLLPTFYDLAGGAAPLPEGIDGVSIRPLLDDPTRGRLARAHDALIFHRPQRGQSAIRQGDYKLMLNWTKQGGIRSRALYKLDTHPREEGADLAEAQPKRAAALEKLLLEYLESVDAEKAGPVAPKRKS